MNISNTFSSSVKLPSERDFAERWKLKFHPLLIFILFALLTGEKTEYVYNKIIQRSDATSEWRERKKTILFHQNSFVEVSTLQNFFTMIRFFSRFVCVCVHFFVAVLDFSHKCICIWKTLWNQTRIVLNSRKQSVDCMKFISNPNASYVNHPTSLPCTEHQNGISSIEMAMIGKSFIWYFSWWLGIFRIAIKKWEFHLSLLVFAILPFIHFHILYCLFVGVFSRMENSLSTISNFEQEATKWS